MIVLQNEIFPYTILYGIFHVLQTVFSLRLYFSHKPEQKFKESGRTTSESWRAIKINLVNSSEICS